MTAPWRRSEPDDVVAFGAAGAIGAARLWSDVARVEAVLPVTPGRVLLVFETDRYAFTVALLAAWAGGHLAVVPPDNRRSTLASLHRTCQVVLHDTYSGLAHQVARLLGDDAAPDPRTAELRGRVADRWSASEPCVELFGSGARRDPRPEVFSGASFARELEGLARGRGPLGRRVAGSVPPSSRYGLTWGVLRPLFEGGAFHRAIRVAPPDWGAARADGVDTLVTVPAHLRAAPRLAEPQAEGLVAVVSSSSMLAPAVAAHARVSLGVTVTDVLTITTVGAVAWRAADDFHWTVRAGLEVRENEQGRLVVADGDVRFEGVDLIAAERGERTSNGAGRDSLERFQYLGRADERIATADGFAAVADLEALAATLPEVRDAAALLGPTPGAPEVLACVAPAAVAGEAVRAALEARLGPGTRVRVAVAPTLDRDAFGRLPRSRALRMFGLGPRGEPRCRELTISPAEASGEHRAFEVVMPADYVWFDGHFDQYPVLPAAIQLHEIVLPCLRMTDWALGRLRQAQRLKFTGRIGPGDRLRVELRRSPPDAVHFEIRTGGRACASGRLKLGPEGPV